MTDLAGRPIPDAPAQAVNSAREKARAVLSRDASENDRDLADGLRFACMAIERVMAENAEKDRKIARLEERLRRGR
jgi:hypothetical protein